MTTAAQVKKWCSRCSLTAYRSRNGRPAGFTSNRCIISRAILIDRTAYAEEFEAIMGDNPPIPSSQDLLAELGGFLANERSRRQGLWFMSDPDVELSLIEAIEQQALPKLRAIKTLDDYLAFVSQHVFRHKLFDWPHCNIIVDVALGDLKAARAICEQNIQRWSIGRMTRI
ncbi:MAG: hypothetical protein R3D52_13900 [Xanthobacteraceae bacterium]